VKKKGKVISKNEKKNTTNKTYSDEINKDIRPKATDMYERKTKQKKMLRKINKRGLPHSRGLQ
jgi:hypothetical protein